jgi:hypothetical protein
MTFFLPLGCPFQLMGVLCAEVDGVRNDFWRGHFAVWLYLVAKPSHVRGGGVDVDGLACPLHRPMVCRFHVRGHDLLPDAVLSYRCSGR